MLKTVLMIALIIISVVLTIIVLFQEGKSAGLGSLGGQSASTESYWSKNKGRSREGMLVKATTVLVILFFVIAAVLNIGSL
ncbi:MAG: preprotein translocase subunit SecG [Lachnospiraceae bacterium]|nr:preprotein translocase subunit SecG [Lachnospiraceae bacterium]